MGRKAQKVNKYDAEFAEKEMSASPDRKGKPSGSTEAAASKEHVHNMAPPRVIEFSIAWASELQKALASGRNVCTANGTDATTAELLALTDPELEACFPLQIRTASTGTRLPRTTAYSESNKTNWSKEVRAVYTESTVRVYQAYNNEIADAALEAQRFVDPWKPGRMTWIKPSAVWMGYRCGWSQKDTNQARVLAIDLKRESFDRLLRTAVLEKAQTENSNIIVQWDPERGMGGTGGKDAWTHAIIDVRSLQMGLRGDATLCFASGDIAKITDVTGLFTSVGKCLEAGDREAAAALLPQERIYEIPADLPILQDLDNKEIRSKARARVKAERSKGDDPNETVGNSR